MKHPRQKLKLLYLLQILTERTDEEHSITLSEIIDALEQYGVKAERKSIYDDLECLSLYGVDICTCRSKTTGYYVGSRDFELPELKLLVDSVQSSKFLSAKKSMELISKIEKLTSNYNAKKLQRQVYITNRIKTFNEQIYYNIDKIHDAIAVNKKISFKYFNLDVNKQKIFRKNGERYIETPVSMTWDDENYYLITYKEKYGDFTHYRVDKMEDIEIDGENRQMPEKTFDLSEYSKRMFSMFGGEETEVAIRFENSLAGVVFDRFGMDVPITEKGENTFVCRVKVAVSDQFVAWVMSFGNRAKILSPDSVLNHVKTLLKECREIYE